ncbi:hypothetical protein, partial [Pseudomonas syringae]|uniref:hypothetical protein n=1 Tax=Pseudomonas syringae TaxID=317 RepID=UPI001F18773D
MISKLLSSCISLFVSKLTPTQAHSSLSKMTPWELAREGGLIDQQITQQLHQSLREQAHSHISTLIAPTDGSRGSELAREG